MVYKMDWNQEKDLITLSCLGTKKIDREKAELSLVQLGCKRSKPHQPDEPGDVAIEIFDEDGQQVADFRFDSIDDQRSYIDQFYLGQKVNEVLEGPLRQPPPNFSFQSCHDRRKSVSRLKPGAALKRPKLGEIDEPREQPFMGAKQGGKGKVTQLSMQALNSQNN